MVENMSQLSLKLEDFEKDSRWFYENINLLRKKNFTGKFIAIKNENVIDSNNNVDILIKSLEIKGENPSCLVIEFVYPEGTIILL